ncbi:MAG: TetR/AcrR family transcriptional regulator [Caulobacteraceae bacterium]
MSTKSPAPQSPAPVERRRKPEAVRRDALEIGRRLLIEGGPGAITLKAVGAELGMSHANLIHHFGSAELFQAQLRDAMVEDLTRTVTALVGEDAQGEADVAAIVERVFEAYRSGGIGVLMAWSVLAGPKPHTDQLARPLGELVGRLEPFVAGGARTGRAREIVALVTLLAFADSLIGRALAERVGLPPDAVRGLTARVVDGLLGEGSAVG